MAINFDYKYVISPRGQIDNNVLREMFDDIKLYLNDNLENDADFATKQLDNLSSVAINTSLISDSNGVDDLGSSSNKWQNGYINKIFLSDGTSANPSLTFSNDQDTGIIRTAATGNQMEIITGGVRNITFTGDNVNFYNSAGTNTFQADGGNDRFIPGADNTYVLGDNGLRWTAVWAVDGTINTSHSSTKENIQDLPDPEIPRGVRFKRGNRDFIGYLNDKLPDEARPKGDPKSNYTNAVIGILCYHVQKLKDKVEKLDRKTK